MAPKQAEITVYVAQVQTKPPPDEVVIHAPNDLAVHGIVPLDFPTLHHVDLYRLERIEPELLQELEEDLYGDGVAADLKSKIASAQEIEQLVDGENYKKWQRDYMR